MRSAILPGLVAVLGLAVLVLLERRTLDWMRLQEDYRAGDATFAIGVRERTVVADGSGRKERCVTCHLGMSGYAPREGTVFGSHPDVFHEVTELDCVACHKGDPDAVERCSESRYGLDRPLEGRLAWASCLHCHDPAAWPEAERYGEASRARDELERIARTFGCMGCHRLSSRGGVIGPSLADVGRERVSDLTAPHATVYDRMREKVRDSRASNPSSIMPVTRLEEASASLVAAYLSLNGVLPASPGRWEPGAGLETRRAGKELYGAFCSGCHNRVGEGRERGDDNPYGVPTLSSKLLAHYVTRGYLTRTIAMGRVGTFMEGFRKGHDETKAGSARNILSAEELASVVSFVESGAFAEYGPTFEEVAEASCAACHPTQRRLHASMTRPEKVAYFKRHPPSWSVERLCELERLACPPPPEKVEKARELYARLCRHCHDAPVVAGELRTREVSAPRIDAFLGSPERDDAFFLMNVICGRGDAPSTKWRHLGVVKREWGIDELVAVIYYLRRGARE